MPAAFITSPTLAPARPRSRSRRDALATIRPWLFSFSSCDIRIGPSQNLRLTTWKIVIILVDVNRHPNGEFHDPANDPGDRRDREHRPRGGFGTSAQRR